MKKQTQQQKLVSQMAQSKGRFFGIQTKTGEKINAQFRSLSPQYITVYDRNAKRNRKLKHTSVLKTSGL